MLGGRFDVIKSQNFMSLESVVYKIERRYLMCLYGGSWLGHVFGEEKCEVLASVHMSGYRLIDQVFDEYKIAAIALETVCLMSCRESLGGRVW